MTFDRSIALVFLASACAAQQPDSAAARFAKVARELPPPAAAELASAGVGCGFARSPDGTRWAWLSYAGNEPIGMGDQSQRPVELCIAHRTHGEVETKRIAVPGCKGDWRGPQWLPDSLAVLIVRRVAGDDGATVGCLDRCDVATGEITRLAQFPDRGILGSAIARDGESIAVLTAVSDTACELCLCARDGKVTRRIAVPNAWGNEGAVSWSPDQQTLAVATGAGLFFVGSDGGEARRCCDVPKGAVTVAAPVWLDASVVAVAAGGGLVVADAHGGQRFLLTEGDLHTRIDCIAVRADDRVVVAVGTIEKDGGLVSLLAGAGHPKKHTFATVDLIDLDDGEHERVGRLETEITDRGRWTLPYLPGITELLQPQ